MATLYHQCPGVLMLIFAAWTSQCGQVGQQREAGCLHCQLGGNGLPGAIGDAADCIVAGRHHHSVPWPGWSFGSSASTSRSATIWCPVALSRPLCCMGTAETEVQATEQYCQFGRRRFHSGQADGAVWEASGSNLMQGCPVIPDTLNLKSMGPFSLVGLNGRARPPGGHWAFAINELCH